MSLSDFLPGLTISTQDFVILSVVFGVGIILVMLAFMAGARKQKARLARVSKVAKTADPAAAAAVMLRRGTSDSSIAFIDKLIKRWVPNPQRLRHRLMQTGYRVSLGQYVMICFFIAAASLSLRFAFAEIPFTAALFGGIAAGVAIPHRAVSFLIQRRQNKFVHLFPEAIDLIVRGLKSGLPASESIRVVGQEIEDPIGIEFREAADQIRFGMTMTQALNTIEARIGVPEFRFFITSLNIQQETGGNLAETLENLGRVLRGRRQIKLKIKALSSEAKASAWIIGCLPFVMFGIILMMNYGYASQLYTDERGIVMVGCGLVSYSIGIAVMRKMTRFEI